MYGMPPPPPGGRGRPPYGHIHPPAYVPMGPPPIYHPPLGSPHHIPLPMMASPAGLRPYHPPPVIVPPHMPPPPPPPPQLTGREEWERGLAECLKSEEGPTILTAPKYNVKCMVLRQQPTSGAAANGSSPKMNGPIRSPPPDPPRFGPSLSSGGGGGSAATSRSVSPAHQPLPSQELWVGEPGVALDLGVLSIRGAHKPEMKEEVMVPKGYEGAPPVVLSTMDVLGDDDDDVDDHHGAWGNKMQNGVLGSHDSPASSTRTIRLLNEWTGTYLLREVIILPRDGEDAQTWLMVEIGGHYFSSRDQSGYMEQGLLLGPGVHNFQVTLSAEQEADVGILAKWVLLRLEGPAVGQIYDMHTHSFMIGRKVVATVLNEDAKSLLNVEALPFVPKELSEWFEHPAETVVGMTTGQAPFQPRAVAQLLEQLGEYGLPAEIRTAYRQYQEQPKQDPYAMFEIRKAPTNLKDFLQNMRALLSIEEAQAYDDIRRYDLYHVQLVYGEKSGRGREALTTTIIVPGAAEKRPYLAYGDEVMIRPAAPPTPVHGQRTSKLVEIHAVVIRIKEDKVELLLPSTLPVAQFPSGVRCHVRFSYERFGFRFLQRALEMFPPSHERLVFPTQEGLADGGPSSLPDADDRQFKWVHPAINDEQKAAVRDIVNKAHGSVPYIIFGPPGTGKTLTVIESIVQVCRFRPGARILACAPSDTAADILADRLSLHGFDEHKMLRLNWWQRLQESLPPRLLKYTCRDPTTSLFSVPEDPFTILKYQIIVCTCASSGLLSLLQERLGAMLGGNGSSKTIASPFYLTHIFIDEASQALQPEVLVPLALGGPQTTVILAGDPRQLGSITRSPLVQEMGLGKSLQEHLMDTRAIYDVSQTPEAASNRSCMTRLVKNYRSHQAIIEVPSRLFYNDTLEQHADQALINCMLGWELLPAPRDFPMLFYGVLGTDYHDLDSPSFYNPVEAAKVADIIAMLLNSKTVKCTTEDIGVITAFRKQVLKLRSLLRSRGLGAINVGQVEDFQGQESKVIIISTVLSERHKSEMRERLGFLGHPKRFNVAVTRAQALTVVIGNPYVLYHDENWRELLEFCRSRGGYRGCDCSLLGMDEDDDDLNMLDAIAHESLLGRANTQGMYPVNLESFFNDAPWRVLL